MTAPSKQAKYKLMSYAAQKEAVQIPIIRKAVGLSKIRTGFRECLSCDKEFFSSDLKNQHCCDRCRKE